MFTYDDAPRTFSGVLSDSLSELTEMSQLLSVKNVFSPPSAIRIKYVRSYVDSAPAN